MKILKTVAISLLGLIILLGVGGFLFIKKKITPDPSYLELSESSNFVPIKWIESEHSAVAALLLPIKFKGIPHTFYLQFDTGAPSTLLYKKTMQTIQEKYPNHITAIDSSATTSEQTFHLGEMKVHSKRFQLYDRGVSSIDWEDTTAIYRIGTLGADIIDGKITIMDFQNHCCYFGEHLPKDFEQDILFYDLKYKMRKVQLPAVTAGVKGNLLHDTGTSGFELITNKKTWKNLATANAKPKEAFKVKSWKKELTAYNIASDKSIKFEATSIDLEQVTYIEGASFMQHALMRATGMGGMIGNQVFMGKILILNCKKKKYAILD